MPFALDFKACEGASWGCKIADCKQVQERLTAAVGTSCLSCGYDSLEALWCHIIWSMTAQLLNNEKQSLHHNSHKGTLMHVLALLRA